MSRKDTSSYHFLLHKNSWRQPGTLLASAPELPAQVLSYCGGGSAALDPHPLVLPWPKSPKSISHSEGESGSKSGSEGLAFVWKDLLLRYSYSTRCMTCRKYSERLAVSSATWVILGCDGGPAMLPRLQHCNVRIDCQCCEVDSGVCR